jgi:hypothetical protein
MSAAAVFSLVFKSFVAGTVGWNLAQVLHMRRRLTILEAPVVSESGE